MPAEPSTAAVSQRVDILDGIRGIAIVLVVLSHGWALWPTGFLTDHVLTSALFQSGNYGVSIFFVVGAFVATRALLRNAASPVGLNPTVTLARRFVRLSAQLYLLLGVVVLVSVLDLSDPFRDRVTRVSVLHVATYTWNWYLQGHSGAARSDLGHLWYLSVDLQVFVLILALVHLFRRRPGWLVVALATIFVGVVAWRFHISGQESLYQSLLRTTARMDAPIAGALAAAALPYLVGLRRHSRPIAVGSLVALVPLLHLNVSNESYFSWPGLALDAALALLLVSCTLTAPPRVVAGALGGRALVWLGRRSLGIYLWHYPIFFFVARHTHDWRWQARTVLALLLVAAAVTLGHLLVERRVSRLVAAPAWDEAAASGVPAYVAARLRRSRLGRRGPVPVGPVEGSVPAVSASGAAAGRSGSAPG